MTIIGIALLILLGILLLILEFLVVPGITFAGIGGALLIAGGIFFSYDIYGTATGNYTLFGTSLFVIIIIYISLKTKTWKRFMLNAKIDSQVNSENENKFKVGDFGVSISRLAPIGQIMINETSVEASSNGQFIDQNVEIEIVKIEKSKIIVKPKEK